MVVKRGTNDAGDRADGAPFPRQRHHRLRFIEFMDVGASNHWQMDDVLPSADVVRAHRRGVSAGDSRPTTRARPPSAGGYRDGARRDRRDLERDARVLAATAAASACPPRQRLYLCLFATEGYDLRALLRAAAASDLEIANAIAQVWRAPHRQLFRTAGRPGRAAGARANARSRCPTLAADPGHPGHWRRRTTFRES